MRIFIKIIVLLIIISSITYGCRYKEGPVISFNSVDARLMGRWKVIEISSSGNDSINYFNDSIGGIMNVFYQEGVTSYKIRFEDGRKEIGGLFSFRDHKKAIYVYFAENQYIGLGPIGGGKRSLWEILKLTTKNLKITTDFNGSNYNILFIKL